MRFAKTGLPTFDWRKDLPPLLLFLVMPLLCFPELFFKDYTLFQADLTWKDFPLRVYAAEVWLSGHVPLWNPYVLSGFPMLAEALAGVLYPLIFIFALPIPAYRAFTLFITIHFTLAAAFTYFLVRVQGLGRSAATLAGLSFGFGGFLMAQIINLNIMVGAAWLPLVLAAFILALRTQRPLIAVLGGVPLALQILGAQPQIVFYTIILLLAYGLFKSVEVITHPSRPSSPLREIARIWGFLGLMLGVGLLLGAPQWLPTWELQRLSVRSAGLAYEKMIDYSLPPVQWLTLALPSMFGNNVVSSYRGASANFEETYVYAGILPLILAFLSWRARPRSEVIFLWVVLVVAAILSMGGYTSLYWPVQYLPGFTLFRVPARWLMLVNFSLASLAAWGMDAFVRRPGSRRLRIGLLILWVGVAVLILLIWLLRDPLAQGLQNLPLEKDMRNALSLGLQRGLFEVGTFKDLMFLNQMAWWLMPSIALVTRLGLSAALLIAYSARRLSRQSFIVGAVVLTAVDMALAGGSAVNQVTEASYWGNLSAGARYVMEAQKQNAGRLFAIVDGNENMVPGLGQYLPSIYHVYAASGHKSPLQLRRYSTITDLDNEFLSLSLTGTRYLLTQEFFEVAPHVPIRLVHRGDDNWYVYENLEALPRVFVVHQAVAAASGEEALNILQSEGFDPHTTVVLETDTPGPSLATTPEPDNEDVIITRDDPAFVQIEANLTGDGYLILADNDYPGWQVYVDGQSETITPANYFARAVYLEAGEHVVQFIYEPISFRLGLVLAAVGVVTIIGAVWSTYGYRRSP
jgi:hypothetical protein